MTNQQDIQIDPLLYCSFRLNLRSEGDADLGTATGFVVMRQTDAQRFLITNWHVVAGRHPLTGHDIDEAPEYLAVDFHRHCLMGRWRRVRVPLRDKDHRPVWLEHPLGRKVDVVAIPLPILRDVLTKPFPIDTANTAITVAQAVHVIGFPMGASVGGHWPIWLTGHIASDPFFDFDGRPAFLADVRVRGGMSGSPVVVTSNMVRATVPGGYKMLPLVGSTAVSFIGVYSSRVDERLDIGCVWRPHVIDEILSGVLNKHVKTGQFNADRPDAHPPLIDEDGAPIW